MEDTNFWINLAAKLNKSKSKQQIKSDAKSLGEIYVQLIGKLNKTKTKAQIKADLANINGTLNLNTKVNSKSVAQSVQQATKQAQKKASSQSIQMSFSIKKDKLVNDIKLLAQQNSKLFNNKEMASKYNSILDGAKFATTSKELSTLRLQLSAFRSELKVTGNAGLTMGNTLRKGLTKVFELFGSYGILMAFTRQLRNAWTESLNLDKTMTNLSKVADELSNRDSFPAYLDKCINKAKELRVNVTSLIDATTEFKKQGFSLGTSEDLAEVASVLENVGDMSIDDAIKTITSNINAFDEIDGYATEQYKERALAVADKINNISNHYSIDAEGLANALRECAAVMEEGNTSIDETAALITAGNRTFQDPTYLGNALKILTLRMQGAKTELRSLDEDTDNMAVSTAKLQEKIEALTNIDVDKDGILDGGFDILESDGETFKSIYQDMNGIASAWKEMSDVDQSSLLELIAGKNRSAAIASILDNMSEAQDIYASSLESSGSATEEFERYQQSAEAAVTRFGNTMTESYNAVLGGNLAKGLANTGSSALGFANDLDLINSSLKGLLAIGVVKLVTNLSIAFKSSAIQASNFAIALNTTKNLGNLTKGTQEYTTAIRTLKTASSGLSELQLKQVLSSNNLSQSQRIQILQTTGLSKAQAQAKLAQMGLTQTTNAQTAANGAAAASTFSLSVAVKGFGLSLKTAFLSNPIGISIMALSMIIGAVSSKVSEYNQAMEETRQKNIEAGKEASEQAKNLSDVYTQYEKLSSIQNRTTSQEEEFKTAVENITTALGTKAETLSGLTAGTDEYTQALKNVTAAELENQYITAVKARKSAEEDLGKESYSNWDGSHITIQINKQMTGVEEHMKALETIKEQLSVFEDVGTYGLEWEPVNFDKDKDNMENIIEYYNALKDAQSTLILEAQSTGNDSLLDSNIYKDIDNTISSLTESVEKYQTAIYNELKLEYMWQNGVPTTIDSYNSMEKAILDNSNAGKTFKETLKGMLSQDFSNLTSGVKESSDALTDLGNSAQKATTNTKESLEDILKSYPEVIKLATVGKLDEDILTSTEEYADLLKKLGINAESSNSDIKDIVEQIQAIADDNPIDNLKAISDELSVLGNSYKSFKNGDKLDIDQLSDLQDTFGNLDYFDEFVKKAMDAKTSTEDMQHAYDALATEYLSKSEVMQSALQGVTNETKAATIAMLKQMGVVNADEIVTAALTAQQLYLKLNMDDSTESIYTQISGLLEHSNASGTAKASLFNLVLEEQIFSNTNLNTSGKIAQLEQLGLAFGITADAAHSSASAMEAIRFAGRAAGKDAAEQTKKELFEQNSNWYHDKIAKKYASNFVNYKAPGGSKKTDNDKKGKGASSKQEYKETVDWVEKTITLLTNKINLLNAMLDNTTSYKNQIKYVKKLADAQEKLIKAYDKAESVRSKTYNASLKKLSKSDRSKVESGTYTIENFKWTKSSDSKKKADQEKRYENIQTALEARDALSSAQQDSIKAKTELKKLASKLADKTWEKATSDLERFNNQMDLLEKKLANTNSYKGKNTLLAKQLDLEQKILLAKEKALAIEKQEAQTIGKKIKKDYKKLPVSKREKIDKSIAKNDKLDIASLNISPSSSLYQYMIEYNAFIDKFNKEKENFDIEKQESIESINEKSQAIVDNVWDEAMEKVENLSNEIESLDKVLNNTNSFKERNKIIEKQIQLLNKLTEASKQAVQDEKNKQTLYEKNIKKEQAKDKKRKKKQISKKDNKTISDALKSGKKINLKELTSVKINSDLYKNLNKRNNTIDKVADGRIIYQDKKQENISETNQKIKDKYSSIQNTYNQKTSDLQSKADKLNSLIDLAETKGQGIGSAYYKKLIQFQKRETGDLTKEKENLEKQLQSDIKKGRITIYDDKWYDAIAAIQDCEKGIIDSKKATEEFNNSLRELDWTKFDQLKSKLEEITNESNFLIGLYDDKDNLFDSNGKININGLTVQGLHAQNYDTYLANAEKNAEEIKKIDASLANDPYNKKLLDRRQELLSAQQQAITNSKSEKDSVISLVENGYNKQIDSLSKLVSKQQELLDKEKELHDYEKSIRNKSNNITMLEKQIQALSLSTDRADIAKRLQLEEDLKNSREDLEEEQYQHSISTQKDALSDALKDYKEQVEDYLKDRDKVFEDALRDVNSYHSSILTNIENKAQSVGYEISDSLIKVWSNTTPVTTYADTVVNSMTGIASAIENVNSELNKMYLHYEKIAKENIKLEFKDSDAITTSAKVRDILGEANGKNGASNNGTSDLNKYLASLGYSYLDKDGMVELAKALGIKGMDSIEGIRENGGTSVIVTELKKYMKSNKSTMTEIGKQGTVSASNVKKVMDLIQGASEYTDKRDKLSDLNKHIYDNYDKKYLSKNQMLQLAKYLGEPSVKNVSDLTEPVKKKLLKKLKDASFKTGGMVELVKQTGEDGISLVRRGEGILSQEQVQMFKNYVPIMNNAMKRLENNNLVPVQNNMNNSIAITAPLVEVKGNLDNVTQTQLQSAIKDVPNMLVNQMNKYGSRGSNLIRR